MQIFQIVLLFALLFLPSALAATIEPVPAFVVQVASTQTYTTPQGAFSAQNNFTFMLSPSDPDQVTGSLNYTIWENDTTANGWTELNCYSVGNCNRGAIPGRPGWVYILADVGTAAFSEGPIQPGEIDTYVFNVTAHTLTESSVGSCLASVEQRLNGSHGQCGAPQIFAPLGVAATVLSRPSNATSNIEVRWPLSLNDTNQTQGNFSYRVFYDYSGPAGLNVVNATLGLDPYQAGYDLNGTRLFNSSWGLGGSVQLGFRIRAEDPLTHQWSNVTCTALVNAQNVLESGGCGSLSAYTTSLPSIAPGPTFPMLDIPAQAATMGIDSATLGYLVAGLFSGILMILGYLVAREVGILIAGALSFAFGAALGLVPPWLVVVGFTLSVSIIVIATTKGGRSS